MTEIKIFVVKTEVHKINNIIRQHVLLYDLEQLKVQLCREFGGLTKIPFKGYWKNSENRICEDFGELWLIYTDSKDCYEIIEAFAKKIKILTSQNVQAFTIDNKLFLA